VEYIVALAVAVINISSESYQLMHYDHHLKLDSLGESAVSVDVLLVYIDRWVNKQEVHKVNVRFLYRNHQRKGSILRNLKIDVSFGRTTVLNKHVLVYILDCMH
jgi:hypothetical protein